MKMSWMPSNSGVSAAEISMMMFRASRTYVGVLPTDMVGIRWPFSVMAAASTTATSTGPHSPARTEADRRDRWSSLKLISPRLMAARMTRSLMYGRRQLTTPALAKSPSTSAPVEAPAYRLIFRSSPASARRASSMGTSLGYPAVKPEMKRFIPLIMVSAALADVVIFFFNGS